MVGWCEKWGHLMTHDLGVSENSVPLNPMVNDHYPVFKWLFHWEYTLFSDKPISDSKNHQFHWASGTWPVAKRPPHQTWRKKPPEGRGSKQLEPRNWMDMALYIYIYIYAYIYIYIYIYYIDIYIYIIYIYSKYIWGVLKMAFLIFF